MFALSKFKVLKYITNACLIQPGSIHKARKYYFLSFQGILYIVTVIYLTYNLVDQVKSHLAVAADGPPTPASSVSLSTNASKEEEDFPFPPPPPFDPDNDTDSSNAGQVVMISLTSSELLNNAINLILRLFIFISFPSIISIFRGLMQREFCPLSYRWARDEIIFVILLTSSLILQFHEIGYSTHDQIRHRRRKGSITLRDVQVVLRNCVLCVVAKSFLTECITFVLVIYTIVVANNLQELGTYLDDQVNSQLTLSRLGLDSLLEFEFPQEFQMYGKHPQQQKKGQQHSSGATASSRKRNAIMSLNNPIFTIVKPGPRMMMMKEDEELSTDISCLLRRYFDWFNLWKESEVLTGFLSLLIFLNTTVNLCICAFTGISNYMDKGLGHQFVYNVIRTIFSIIHLFCLGNSAQFLLDVNEGLEEKLIMESWKEGSFSVRSPMDFSEIQKEKQLSYLLHHMSQNPINLSALGFFIASRSTLTSIGGVIVTYLVVLIQFRTSS